MTPERYERVAGIFHDATGVDAAERKEFLAGACGEDSELLREVDSLLRAGDQAGMFLASSANGAIASASAIVT